MGVEASSGVGVFKCILTLLMSFSLPVDWSGKNEESPPVISPGGGCYFVKSSSYSFTEQRTLDAIGVL